MVVARDLLRRLALARGIRRPGVVVVDVQLVRRQDARTQLRSAVGERRLVTKPSSYP